MMDMLGHEFMRNALLAGLLASLACGVIGSLVVVRRLVFIAGGISHTAYGGIGLGYLLDFPPIYGAAGASVLAALIIGLIDQGLGQHADTVIGVIWAVGMALGVVFVALTPGYAPDLMSFLFGDILLVPSSDIIHMIVLNALILLITGALFKEFRAVSYDELFARVRRVPAKALHVLMLCMIALTTVMLIRIVGIILVIALLTIPAAIARLFSRSLAQMMVLATLIGMFVTTTGLFASYALGVRGIGMPAGPLIILLAGTLYLAAVAAAWLRPRLAGRS